jgi:hypothetical protein
VHAPEVVEHLHLDSDQGEHYYEYEEHAYDIHVEHMYEHDEHKPQYMPTRPANTSILQLQDQHRSEDIFVGIVRIFNLNIFLIYV